MAAKRILVVDDEPKMVKACTNVLEMGGFEARGATGGAEAIALCKSERFDLTILDLKMPDIDGLEVLTALRKHDPNATVIIFTAYGTKEHAIKALRLGVSEFLEKPFNAQVLVATVKRVLERGNSTAVRGDLRSFSLPSIITASSKSSVSIRRAVHERGD